MQPVGPDDLAPLFPMALIEQEVTAERYVDIPGGVLDVYRLWRPSPLFRARRLEQALDTPAKIYYKYEGVSPAGSHKPNTVGAAGLLQPPRRHRQADHRDRRRPVGHRAGVRVARSTAWSARSGRWPRRTGQKPYRRTMMEIWGATLHPSPSPITEFGRSLLAENPDHPAAWASPSPRRWRWRAPTPTPATRSAACSTTCCCTRPIIGEEALLQLAKVGETPDVLVGCTGGGSNFGGLAFPFLREKLAGRMNPTIRCVEPAACPSLTKGEYRYDFGDTAGMTPLLKMHTLGHGFIPEPIHAGGLRYHGMAPLVSHVYELGSSRPSPSRSASASPVPLQFARTEGIVPAPEPTHAHRRGDPRGAAPARSRARRR